MGEAVAYIWKEDVGYNIPWCLGIVDQIVRDKVYVPYMRKSDKQGLSWLFPDEAEVYDTIRDQIIARNMEIKYSMTAMIRGNISRQTLTHIGQCFEKISTGLVLILIPRIVCINPFQSSVAMLYPLKTSKNLKVF